MSTILRKEWFDDDSYWIDLYKDMFPERSFAEAADQADQRVKLANPRGHDVLDLACGPGRFSIPLAQKGFRVTGGDRTEVLLERARTRAAAAQVEITWLQQDMRHFVRPSAFDLIISVMTSFGCFEDRQDDLKVLRNMLTNLKLGGACVIDLKGKECVARSLQPMTAEVRDNGTITVRRSSVVDDWTRVRNELLVIREGQPKRTYNFVWFECTAPDRRGEKGSTPTA